MSVACGVIVAHLANLHVLFSLCAFVSDHIIMRFEKLVSGQSRSMNSVSDHVRANELVFDRVRSVN